MSIFDDIIGKNADDRLAEEMLYAEAMREIEQGIRRDGLWGKAIAESDGDDKKAKALYLKLRVQSLKDELEIFQKEKSNSPTVEKKEGADDSKSEYTAWIFIFFVFCSIIGLFVLLL